MDLETDLIFEGRQLVRWIKEDDEKGLIEMVCDSDGDEIVFYFERVCLEAMARAINEFLATGKTTHDHTNCKGRIKPHHVILGMEHDKKISIEVNLGEAKEENPYLLISSGKAAIEIWFNEIQAKALKETFEKIVEIKRLSKKVENKQIIKSA